MREIAKRVGDFRFDVQLIATCGRNAGLKKQLDGLKTRNRIHVTGFTQQIPYYMQLSDFLIGKPGPGSISEAMQMQLPVLVEKNAWTLPQERYNADWVAEQEVGIVLRNFREIATAIEKLLRPGVLGAMRQRTACLNNRAVFEIVDILRQLLNRTAP